MRLQASKWASTGGAAVTLYHNEVRVTQDKSKDIIFEVSDKGLYVANGGAAFSRSGVIGICASHLSDKQESGGASDDYECRDESLVAKIRERELKTYRNDPNRITGDFQGESETKSDYDGRFVWELLQNADDAMSSDSSEFGLIGSKGLGFKSVLEVCDEIEIHSEPFHFRFSAEQTRALLKGQGLQDDPPTLTFRIPHDCEPDPKAAELLETGYSTVVHLPFRNEASKSTVLAQLDRLAEPLFLLLVREISRIRIKSAEGEFVRSIERSGDGLQAGEVRLLAWRDGQDASAEQAQVWKRWVGTFKSCSGRCSQVAICLPLSEEDEPVPYWKNIPFHVFFETSEATNARALIHAPFDLQQNRKHTRESEDDEAILEAFDELLCEVIEGTPPVTLIEAFKGILESGEGSPSKRLQSKIWHVLREESWIPVIGGKRVAPREVKLWKDGLGEVLKEDDEDVKIAHLLTPNLRECGQNLKVFGATDLRGIQYFELLRACKNDTLESCLMSYEVLVQRLREHGEKDEFDGFRSIPCWWTVSGFPRPLSNVTTFLLKAQPDWPEWLSGDVLHPRLAKSWSQDREELDRIISGDLNKHFLQGNEDFLHRALVPAVKDWDCKIWGEQGWEALRAAHSWWKPKRFDEVTPYVPFQKKGPYSWSKTEKDRRTKCSEAFRVPTTRGKWLSAADCYAGVDWEGFQSFDEYFRNVQGGELLLPLSQWPDLLQKILIEEWKPFLRYLGVSWEPKLRPYTHLMNEHHLYRDYVESLPDEKGNKRFKKLGGDWRSNFTLDHFPNCIRFMGGPKNTDETIKRLLPLLKVVKSLHAFHDRSKWLQSSFASYQLRIEPWLPCRPALLHPKDVVAPAEAFDPRPPVQLGRLLPVVDRSGIEDKVWYQDVQDVLVEFGVRTDLPSKASGWHQWTRELSNVTPSSIKKNPDEFLAAASNLFQSYLKSEMDESEFPSDIHIPAEHWTTGGKEMVFSLPSEVYYVDQPHLDEVLHQILQKTNVKTFILKLKQGDVAPQRLGLNLLSTRLSAKPKFREIDDEQRRKVIQDHYVSRREGLRIAAKLTRPLPENLSVSLVRDLQLRLFKDSEHIADVPVLSWRNRGQPLLVNLDKGKWRSLAHGIAVRMIDKDSVIDLFENLLSEESQQAFLDRLRHAGVSESELESVEFEWQSPEKRTEPQESKDPPDVSPIGPQDSSGRQPIPLVNPEPENSSPNAPGEGYSLVDQPHHPRQRKDRPPHFSHLNPATGKKAEDWLWKLLKKALPDQVTRNQRDEENRESDFIVRTPEGREIHIEAKHAQNNPVKVFWSGLECEKAEAIEQDPSRSYFMVILTPSEEHEYEIRWIWKPLEDLKQAKREVEWFGTSGYRQFESDSWRVSDQAKVKILPNRHRFRIELGDEMFEGLDRDSDSLQFLISRIS